MPIQLPNLDDRDYPSLNEEVRALIPRYSREWTNFNPSDPGIMLLEILVWLTDQAFYRVNRIPPATYASFIRLLSNEAIEGSLSDPEVLANEIARVQALVRERYRAVTADDYRDLTLERMAELEPTLPGRAIVLTNVNLGIVPDDTQSLAELEEEAHVSVVVVPNCTDAAESEWCEIVEVPGDPEDSEDVSVTYYPLPDLLDEVRTRLEERRLIGTRIHVVAPSYRRVNFAIRIALSDESTGGTEARVRKSLRDFFDALTGGQDGAGWPAGRNVYKSEVYQIVEGVAGVDHVIRADFTDGEGAAIVGDAEIHEWELVEVGSVNVTVEERRG